MKKTTLWVIELLIICLLLPLMGVAEPTENAAANGDPSGTEASAASVPAFGEPSEAPAQASAFEALINPTAAPESDGGEDSPFASEPAEIDDGDSPFATEPTESDEEDSPFATEPAESDEEDSPSATALPEAGSVAAGVPEAQKGLEIYFLDLGRVDAILIRCDGVTSMLDVGFKKDAAPALKYLKALGVEKLDSYIGSHAHLDHVGGAVDIIDALKPDVIYAPSRQTRTAIRYEGDHRQRDMIDNYKFVKLDDGDTFQIGGATAKCLGPIRLKSCIRTSQKENENSLIFKLTYGSRTFLFTGDTTDTVLRGVEKKYPGELKSDVFKNPHHNGSHDADVLKLVRPAITVFCTSNEEPPAKAYRRELKDLGSKLYITGSRNDGTILITSDGESLDVRCGYPVSGLRLDPVGTLLPGMKGGLNARADSAYKGGLERWLRWESSDTQVAAVTEEGVLTAVGQGVATITATALNGVSDSLEVRVSDVGIAVDRAFLSLLPGEKETLKVRVKGENTEGLTGEWLSEDLNVAIVNDRGEVSAVAPGETRVVARLSNGAEAACRVVVVEIPVKSVKLNKSRITLAPEEKVQLTASVSPKDATHQILEWASSDENVAAVDIYGNVTAVAPGTAKIGVRAPNGKYDLCTVTVKAPQAAVRER